MLRAAGFWIPTISKTKNRIHNFTISLSLFGWCKIVYVNLPRPSPPRVPADGHPCVAARTRSRHSGSLWAGTPRSRKTASRFSADEPLDSGRLARPRRHVPTGPEPPSHARSCRLLGTCCFLSDAKASIPCQEIGAQITNDYLLSA